MTRAPGYPGWSFRPSKRARLAAGEPLVAPGPARDEFEDRAVEALAEQIESEWSEALERLAASDAGLATVFRRRLVATADFSGIVVPVWPADDDALDGLLHNLLSLSLTARERSRRAQDWLSDQPTHAAWIANDASLIDQQSGLLAARVAGVTLDPDAGSTAMMLKWSTSSHPDEMATLRPGVVGSTVVAIPPAAQADTGLAVSIAGWSARRVVLPRALLAQPPGLLLAPFFEEWSLRSWLASCTDTGDIRSGPSPAGIGKAVENPPRRTAAMLIAQDPVGIGEPEGARGWVLYLECRSPAEPAGEVDAPGRARDEVVIALAGTGGEVMIRVFPDGQVVTSQGHTQRVPVERTGEGWMAWVPLPLNITADGAWLRLGLARSDATGKRSSWPRPMFPWEGLPAHAAIGLAEWSGTRDHSRR